MDRKLKIVFLDFDGVLNNDKSFKHQPMDPIDPYAIQLLNDLVRETGACIVISSTWRIGNSLSWLQSMLFRAGFEWPERIIGSTMEISKATTGKLIANKTRGQEIALWLEQVPVDSFVIFDDEDDMDPVKDHLIQTTFERGLLKEHIEQAKKMLNNEI